MTYDFWDENKLADEILAIAEHGELMSELKEKVLLEYHRISWADVAKKCLRIYNKAKKQKRK